MRKEDKLILGAGIAVGVLASTVAVAGILGDIPAEVRYEHGTVIDKVVESHPAGLTRLTRHTIVVEMSDGSVVEIPGYDTYNKTEVDEVVRLKVVATKGGGTNIVLAE